MLRMSSRPVAGRSALAGLPSWRTIATVTAIVITALLILQFGVWYFVGLIAIYGLLDISERMELRRDARNRAAILSSIGQHVPSIGYVGSARHCQKAAWVAKRLGWIACPMRREGVVRFAVRFKRVPGSGPPNALLEALHEARLATRIRLPESAPSFGRRLSERGHWVDQAYWDAGRDI